MPVNFHLLAALLIEIPPVSVSHARCYSLQLLGSQQSFLWEWAKKTTESHDMSRQEKS